MLHNAVLFVFISPLTNYLSFTHWWVQPFKVVDLRSKNWEGVIPKKYAISLHMKGLHMKGSQCEICIHTWKQLSLTLWPQTVTGCNKSELIANLTVTKAPTNTLWYTIYTPFTQHCPSAEHFKIRASLLWPINMPVDSLIWKDIKWQTPWCFCQRQAGEG